MELSPPKAMDNANTASSVDSLVSVNTSLSNSIGPAAVDAAETTDQRACSEAAAVDASLSNLTAVVDAGENAPTATAKASSTTTTDQSEGAAVGVDVSLSNFIRGVAADLGETVEVADPFESRKGRTGTNSLAGGIQFCFVVPIVFDRMHLLKLYPHSQHDLTSVCTQCNHSHVLTFKHTTGIIPPNEPSPFAIWCCNVPDLPEQGLSQQFC